MDSEVADLKKVLRSLVVSSPSEVDLRTLLRDYRNMMGGPIPLAKYGYKDALTFLKERCDDCFLFQGPLSNPILTLIVPKTLQHIDKFVQKQRSNQSGKCKGKRRSIPEAIVKPIEQKPNNNIVRTFRKQTNNSTTCCTIKETTTVDVDSPSEKHEPKAETSKIDIKSIDRSKEQNDSPTNELKSFMKKRALNKSQDLNTDKIASDKTSSKDSGRQTSSSGSISKAAQFEELKQEIQDLLVDYPEGVWCTDLIRLYRERQGRELNFSRFGYTSIVSVAFSLAPAVAATQSSDEPGDWLLQLARHAPRAEPRPRPRPRPRARPRPAPPPRPAAPVDPDDALPGVDFDPDVFPEDCMHYLESIPAAPLSGLQPGAMLELVVGEVYSPSHFWVLRLGDHHYGALDRLMDEMTEYYSSGSGRGRRLAAAAARAGQYAASLYDGDWHRALILTVLDSDTVKVRHVDYGTVETVAVSSLRPLVRRWAALPAQAVRARLAAVRPAGGRRWPRAAAAAFLRRVRDAPLVGNLVAVDPQEDILELFLVDTRGEEDVCIGDELIRAGHADPRADSAVRAHEPYLRPSFAALEAGATPNYADISAYLRDGIALEFVDDYRRHVCASPPPPSPPAPPASPAPPVAVATRVPLLRAPPSPPAVPAATQTSPPPAPASPAALAAPGPAAGGVTLSAAECDTFQLLSCVDPAAAHWFMLSRLGRAHSASTLDVTAPEFRPRASPAPPPPPAPPSGAWGAASQPWSYQLSPPPGFEFPHRN
ncbi:tudor domain-containing protein 5-like [Achroia grisella]|uniref:tudor domain-containing protein 5-like n=1 Tax=Achroia grisella TaxID=688607 RepID=UPI0027D2E84A|nr:tudor domain-containing protein 5-like [Achroia grisella]